MKDQLMHIIGKIKENVTDDSSIIWTKYNSPKELRNELDIYIIQIQLDDFNC